ncbi:hypothetical protein [Metabacillus sp. SLBN-84]
MMAKPNLRQIKHEAKQNSRHLRYRRIAVPRKNATKHTSNPFAAEAASGNFQNDMYFSMNPVFIAWVFIKNIALHCLPAFLLHGVMFMIHSISVSVMGDEYTAPAAAFQILFIAYAICLFFALRKVSDHMAYYNITMLVSKYNINRSFEKMKRNITNLKANKELTVMDHYRMKFNKCNLFPSTKELALEEQLYQSESKSHTAAVRQYAETRRSRLNIENKRAEHQAAKAIADWKQAEYGGVNEYEAMVAKYTRRTVPAVQNIIKEVTSQPNYYL